jgi:nucleoside-diphosphate-sugar epimerase
VSRTVLVTGPAGALGSVVLELLREAGWRTRGLRHRRAVAGCDEVVEGDVTRPDELSAAVAGVDAVLHLAALTHARDPRAYHRVNAHGTRNLVKAAGPARVVLASTRAIDPAGGAYSRSKAAAEGEVRAGGIDWSIVRLPEVFGAGGREGVDGIIDRARRGAAIPVVGAGGDELCPLPVRIAGAALVAALERPAAAGRTYTLAGECTTVRQFAAACIRIFGTESRIVSVPESAVRILSRVARVAPLPLYPDQLARLKSPKPAPSPEAREELGFAPPPLEEALRALAAR